MKKTEVKPESLPKSLNEELDKEPALAEVDI